MSASDSNSGSVYKHVLALYPYFGSSTAALGIFPPTGLEYIAASMKGKEGKETQEDLPHESPDLPPPL